MIKPCNRKFDRLCNQLPGMRGFDEAQAWWSVFGIGWEWVNPPEAKEKSRLTMNRLLFGRGRRRRILSKSFGEPRVRGLSPRRSLRVFSTLESCWTHCQISDYIEPWVIIHNHLSANKSKSTRNKDTKQISTDSCTEMSIQRKCSLHLIREALHAQRFLVLSA